MSFPDQHRPPQPRSPICGWIRLTALVMMGALGACATSHHRRPRALGFAGASAAVAGSAIWAVGDRQTDPGPFPVIGFGLVAVGIMAIVAAGGWIAAEVSCQVDPDCDDDEECREIPAPPGGIPYKQCVSR